MESHAVSVEVEYPIRMLEGHALYALVRN